jgi:hypothetical protein
MAVVSYHMGMREVYGAAIRLSGMWGSSLDMTGPFEIVGLMCLGALMHQRYAHKFMRTFSSNCPRFSLRITFYRVSGRRLIIESIFHTSAQESAFCTC